MYHLTEDACGRWNGDKDTLVVLDPSIKAVHVTLPKEEEEGDEGSSGAAARQQRLESSLAGLSIDESASTSNTLPLQASATPSGSGAGEAITYQYTCVQVMRPENLLLNGKRAVAIGAPGSSSTVQLSVKAFDR